MPSKEEAIEILKTIHDPELGIDIWTLGLIYKLEASGEQLDMDMTFTSPFCPYGPQLLEQVRHELEKGGFKNPKVTIVFQPPWEPPAELREMMGV